MVSAQKLLLFFLFLLLMGVGKLSIKGQIVTILGLAGYIASREGTDQLVERLAIQKGPSRHHHGGPLDEGVNNHTLPSSPDPP